MYEEVIEKMLKSSNKRISTASYPKFSGEGYGAHKIDIKNFHELKVPESGKKIAFVDGGNAEIMGSGELSLNLVRVGYVIYDKKNKTSTMKFDIVVLVNAINENNEIHYKTSFFARGNKISLKEISFSSFDKTIMLGTNRAEIGMVANAIRRFAELKLAKIVSESKAANIILLDGNLQSTYTGESSYLSELFESCIKNNVILSALSKTSSIFTDGGNLLSAALEGISGIPSWIYHPVVDITNPNHMADMSFVKMHKKSNHVFRFEIFNAQKAKSVETIEALAGNCKDPVFIGYPYGLVEADRVARISNQEKEFIRTIFTVKLKDKNIQRHFSLKNTHEILDRISF